MPPDHVASILNAPETGRLFTPSIIRGALSTADNGQAADLTLERLRTTLTSAPGQTGLGQARPACLAATFAGPGVAGDLRYELVPAGGETKLVQRIGYEFSDQAAIDLLESATTAQNDSQFAAHLTAVRDLIEAGSPLLPAHQDETIEPAPTPRPT